MNFECYENYGKRLTLEDILLIEAELGERLPEDYKEFLLNFGGGTIIGETSISYSGMENDVFVIFGKNEELDLDPMTSRDLRLGDMTSGYPRNSLVIADSIFGHPYFGIIKDGKMEIRWMGYLPEAYSLHVANSFTEFLDMITVTPYED